MPLLLYFHCFYCKRLHKTIKDNYKVANRQKDGWMLGYVVVVVVVVVTGLSTRAVRLVAQ